jgi:signal transduction histidine kinase
MDLFELVHGILKGTQFTNYIIAAQIPTVACLGIMCFIFYKLKFKEFKLISIAWGINLVYLIANIFLQYASLSFEFKLLLSTFFDLTSMCFFLIAIKDYLIEYRFPFLRNTYSLRIYIYIISAAIIVGAIQFIPGSFPIIQYLHLRYVPAAIFDFIVILFLSQYFQSLEKKFLKNRYLSYSTLIYAVLQFLIVAQIDKYEPNIPISIDNIGFAVGLMLKMLILVLISRLMVYAIRITTVNDKEKILNQNIREKESLLKDFSKASIRILDIEKNNIEADYRDRENLILELTLNKILELLSKGLGYYSSYDEKTNSLKIKFTSDNYSEKKGYEYSVDIGLTGKALKAEKWQLMNTLKDRPEYEKFNDIEKLDDKVNSALAFPLLIDNKPHGVFMIECEMENCFTDLDIDIVESLIYQATIAIKNNHLIHDIEISKVFLECLKQIDKEIVYEYSNLEPVLVFILNRVLQLVNCDSGNIDIVKGTKLVCIASTNRTNINTENEISECLSGLAVTEMERQYFPNLENLSAENKIRYKERLGLGYKCELVVPLIVKNEVIGVFNAESRDIDGFTQEDIDKIDGFAGQTAIAIYITKLIEDINEKNRVLENSVDIRNIEMSFLLGHLINHRIGNEVGIIRLCLIDLLDGQIGEFSEEVRTEFNTMLICAEKALSSRTEIRKKVKELITFNPTKIDFMEIKYSLENNAEYRVREKIKIVIVGFESLKQSLVNLNLLMEVFFEIISNAIKSMPDGGKIVISGKTERDFNIISFKDEGCGIAQEKLNLIFNDQYTYWPKNTAGGGIGLFEVKNIVDFWDGDIKAESEINKGTTFTMKLPIKKD